MSPSPIPMDTTTDDCLAVADATDQPSTSVPDDTSVDFRPISSGSGKLEGGLTFMRYDTGRFTPLMFASCPQDVVSRLIYNSGENATTRAEICILAGYNPHTKSGSRRMEGNIFDVVRGLPKQVGVALRQEGRSRVKRFYHKSFQLSDFSGICDDITRDLGYPCPFKVGEFVSFPKDDLTNLRISDGSLKRLSILINMLMKDRAVPLRNAKAAIMAYEESQGINIEIDRKSLKKLTLLLQMKGICRRISAFYHEEDTDDKGYIHFIVRPDISGPEDPLVVEKMEELRAEALADFRSFPSYKQRRRVVVAPPPKEETDSEVPYELDSLAVVAGTVWGSFDELKAGPGSREKHANPFYQRRQTRLYLLHQLVSHFVYFADATKPGLMERFPEAHVPSDDGTAVEDMIVYDDTPDSFLRFVPRLIHEDDTHEGWFCVRYLLRVMPLSMFVLFYDIALPESVLDYLKDPVKRHTMIVDLPKDMHPYFINRFTAIHLDCSCYQLCACGLMYVDATRCNVFASTSWYYCKPSGDLYDTSVASASYYQVRESPERFTRYHYEFADIHEVNRFWFHLRGISLSSPLNYKSHIPEGYEAHAARIDRKCYTRDGQRKRYHIVARNEEPGNADVGIFPSNGAACFRPQLYAHLKRHWELIGYDLPEISWFMKNYQRYGEYYKDYVEENVVRINKIWLTLTHFMAKKAFKLINKPKQVKLVPKWDADADEDDDDGGDESYRAVPPAARKRPGKRTLDDEDIQSAKMMVGSRSRFTVYERNLLVLMRALCEFCSEDNSKLWVDPQVLRRIMKSYTKESHAKTVICLMAASIRENALHARHSEMALLLANLGSSKQLYSMRNKLLNMMGSDDFNEKSEYFCKLFDIAYRLLTREIPHLPSVFVPDSVFYGTIKRCKLVIFNASEELIPAKPLLQSPKAIVEVHEAVVFEAVVNCLLQMASNSMHRDTIVQAYSQHLPELVVRVLQRMHHWQLISYSRLDATIKSSGYKPDFSASSTFHQYFYHGVRRDLIPALWIGDELLIQDANENAKSFGVLYRLIGSLGSDVNVSFSIEENFFENNQKKVEFLTIREIETKGINLAKIKIQLDDQFLSSREITPMVYDVFDQPKVYPIGELATEAISSRQEAFTTETSEGDKTARVAAKLLAEIQNAEMLGLSRADANVLCLKLGVDDIQADEIFTNLIDRNLIFMAGVDMVRFIDIRYALDYCLRLDTNVMAIKPWTKVDGSVDFGIFRWMTESVFINIYKQPFKPRDLLISFFGNVITRATLEFIITFLLRATLIEEVYHECEFNTVVSVFSRKIEKKEVLSYVCVLNAVERFASIFRFIEVPYSLYEKVEKPAMAPRSLTTDTKIDPTGDF